MEMFEYVAVLTSIIVGLGITHLLLRIRSEPVIALDVIWITASR